MALSELMQQNILSKVLEDVALLNSSNKLKYERIAFDGWVDEFVTSDSATIIDIIEFIFEQQFVSVERACVENFDYIRLTGLGNLKTNQARQEILAHVAEHGTSHKEDIRPIIDKYIEMKKANRLDVELDINLEFYDTERT
jgi:hypothetical protein